MSSNKSITVHIERLILDGLPIAHSQRAQLKAEVEAELARLLASDGLAGDLQTHGLWPSLTGGSIELQSEVEPGRLGKQIAQAVYRGIGI
jgi:hypothetical protein